MGNTAAYTRLWLTLSAASYLGLISSISLWTLWIAPPEVDNPALIWLVQVVPLLLPALGLLQKKPRSFIWLCFIVLFYFSASVIAIYQDITGLYGWLRTGFSLVLFISAMLASRGLAQANHSE